MEATTVKAQTGREWNWNFHLGIQCCMARLLKILLPLLLLSTLPAAVQAQFTYTTNDGTITITDTTAPAVT